MQFKIGWSGKALLRGTVYATQWEVLYHRDVSSPTNKYANSRPSQPQRRKTFHGT